MASLPQLQLYNSLSRKKEVFEPITPGFVGIYLCGPTVYGDPHLGHARSAIVFDVLSRYLRYRGDQVRYVRNITDVGHLLGDADSGDDKIGEKARLEKIEPMEVAQRYTNSYRRDMAALGCLPPSIEPLASGHIIEQILMVQQILDEGLAYVSEGSVYFNVQAYQARYGDYGKLSGRVLEDLLSATRDLAGQEEKRNPADFALWKKADPTHIMRWPSPWSDGFPGWHIECSAMSSKYLGKQFDIHGGGMDLLFPHHEAEQAQSHACHHETPVRTWMHVNMIQLNGQKMGKSLGNAINLQEFFTGKTADSGYTEKHRLLDEAYSPMTIRFFMLQAHYRSTLDFSNEALQAARKGYRRLLNGVDVISRLNSNIDLLGGPTLPSDDLHLDIEHVENAFADDFNTALVIAGVFSLLKRIQFLAKRSDGGEKISKMETKILFERYTKYLEVLGLEKEKESTTELKSGLLEKYKQAKKNRDWSEVDNIRKVFSNAGYRIQDGKSDSFISFDE